MPVREGLQRRVVLGEDDLRDELMAELTEPRDTGEPEIIIERPRPATTHLFVIWSKWEDLEQMVRSRIIMDAYTRGYGKEEALKVTVAMGLTSDEASKLGIQ